MPELPEVETVRLGLVPVLEGRRLVRVEQFRADLRWPIPRGFRERLEGRRVTGLRRRAKYLIWDFDDGTVLLMHLGMSGRLVISDHRPELEAHDHLVFTTEDGFVVRFHDARRFGMVDLARSETLEAHRLLAGLGPEPLGNEFSAPVLHRYLAGRRTPVKSALLDQKVVAGLGNIYVCEALHMAGISPFRPAASLGAGDVERLVGAVREVLEAAIRAGGSSLRDHVAPDGELGYFQHSFRVYGRDGEPCPCCGCDGVVERAVQSGRSSFHCPQCQV